MFSRSEWTTGAEVEFSWVGLWFSAFQDVEETGSTRPVEIWKRNSQLPNSNTPGPILHFWELLPPLQNATTVCSERLAGRRAVACFSVWLDVRAPLSIRAKQENIKKHQWIGELLSLTQRTQEIESHNRRAPFFLAGTKADCMLLLAAASCC